MNNYLQRIESIIQKESKYAVNIQTGEGELAEAIRAMTVNKECYTGPVLYVLPDEYAKRFKRLYAEKDHDALAALLDKHGEKLSEEEAQRWEAAMLLQHYGHIDSAQEIYDSVWASNVRKKIHNQIEPQFKEIFSREKFRENAQKMRNRHYDRAIEIAQNTWGVHPGASLGQMCSKLRSYFNDEVSIDSLKRWIKRSGIRPKSVKERKSFTLVIPPGA
ncbi:Uncharacterised protein [Serratia plymuthica]|nr:Uncharacterised protein [Serratia plymuthica]